MRKRIHTLRQEYISLAPVHVSAGIRSKSRCSVCSLNDQAPIWISLWFFGGTWMCAWFRGGRCVSGSSRLRSLFIYVFTLIVTHATATTTHRHTLTGTGGTCMPMGWYHDILCIPHTRSPLRIFVIFYFFHLVLAFQCLYFSAFSFAQWLARTLLFVFRSPIHVSASFLFAWFFSCAATAVDSKSDDASRMCVRCLRSPASVYGWKDFFHLFIIFSRVKRSQTKKKKTNHAQIHTRERARLRREEHVTLFFISRHWIFSFSAVTLALVQIVLSFSNDDDYCMVWCLLYLSRDGVFHLKDFTLLFSRCGFRRTQWFVLSPNITLDSPVLTIQCRRRRKKFIQKVNRFQVNVRSKKNSK